MFNISRKQYHYVCFWIAQDQLAYNGICNQYTHEDELHYAMWAANISVLRLLQLMAAEYWFRGYVTHI